MHYVLLQLMPRLIVLFLLLIITATAANAQLANELRATDSLSQQAVYPTAPALYDTALFDSQHFRDVFAGNYFGIYALTAITEKEWLRFKEVPDPRLLVEAWPRSKEADYIFYLLLLVFFVLVVGINRDFNYFENMFRALTNYRLSLQFAREQVSNRTFASVAYILLFNLLFGLFLIQWMSAAGISSLLVDFEAGWLLLFVLITLIYSVKYIFYKFIGRIFGLKEQVSYYLSQVFLMNRLLALLMLPVLTLLYYAPAQIARLVMFVSIIAIVIAVLLRYLRGIRITSQVLGANTIHFILYFCTVEILPTLIISKLLLNV